MGKLLLLILTTVTLAVGQDDVYFTCNDVDVCQRNVSWCNKDEDRCELCSDYIQACFTDFQPIGCMVYCLSTKLQAEMKKEREKDCPLPTAIAHGSYRGSNVHGGIVTYSCDKGYRLGESVNVTCSDYGIWSGSLPTCEEVTCSRLHNPDNGIVTTTNYTVGGLISFQCNPGYTLHGVSEAYCLETGAWSVPISPMCTKELNDSTVLSIWVYVTVALCVLLIVSIGLHIYCYRKRSKSQAGGTVTHDEEMGLSDKEPLVKWESKKSSIDGDGHSVGGNSPSSTSSPKPSAPPSPGQTHKPQDKPFNKEDTDGKDGRNGQNGGKTKNDGNDDKTDGFASEVSSTDSGAFSFDGGNGTESFTVKQTRSENGAVHMNVHVEIVNNNNNGDTSSEKSNNSEDSNQQLRISEKDTEPKLPYPTEVEDRNDEQSTFVLQDHTSPSKTSPVNESVDSGLPSGYTSGPTSADVTGKLHNHKPVADLNEKSEKVYCGTSVRERDHPNF